MRYGLALGATLLAFAPALTQAKPPEAAANCGQRGRVIFDKDTTLSGASGRKIARFSGGESAVRLLAPPAGGSALAFTPPTPPGFTMPLARGETSDLPTSSYSMSTPPQLQLPQQPRVVKTTREVGEPSFWVKAADLGR